MDRLQQLEQKIADLKRKKEKLQLKSAEELWRKLSTLLGEEFSPEMVVGLVAHTWENSKAEERKTWRAYGETFFRETSGKRSKKTATTDQQTGATKNADKTQHAA